MIKDKRKFIIFITCVLILFLFILLIIFYNIKRNSLNKETIKDNVIISDLDIGQIIEDSQTKSNTNKDQNTNQDNNTTGESNQDSPVVETYDIFEISPEVFQLSKWTEKIQNYYDEGNKTALLAILNKNEIQKENLNSSNIEKYMYDIGICNKNLKVNKMYFAGLCNGIILIDFVDESTNNNYWVTILAVNNLNGKKDLFSVYSSKYFDVLTLKNDENEKKIEDIETLNKLIDTLEKNEYNQL